MSWNIGASTGACVDRPVIEVLAAIESAGIPAVEVGTPPRHFDPWQVDQVRTLAARLHSTGIRPVSIHAPFGGLLELSDPNPHHRHAAVGAILSAAAALKELGGSIVVVHVSDTPRAGNDVSTRLDQSADSLALLLRACSHMGMTLAVENPLPHLVGGHPDEFASTLSRLGPAARVCLDTSHATLGGHWDRLLELCAERLAHVHANDHRGERDDHLPPGDGITDWAHLGSGLRQAGFAGWIMLELACEFGASAECLSQVRSRLDALLGAAPARVGTAPSRGQ